VRETLTLDYASYILALAMGAGKTILIGSIVASEFALAAEYPDGPFVQNALVFAPGKTPIESLRELLSAPYHAILPPRLHGPFAASVKFTFTRDGDPDIPVVPRSLFNVIVTNTEKIRIQKEAIRKSDLGLLTSEARLDEARQDVANRRLTRIATLPHLGVFSDEAHHTYGQSLTAELKKVRRTVDYLHQNTNLVCVVNTTGTPYYERQPLRDVVIWYGLSQGIRDNILKDVSDNIREFDFGGDTRAYVAHVIEDFYSDYGAVTLPNGAPAKLAIYFPQADDLAEHRPVIDATIARLGGSPAHVLVNTSDPSMTKAADIEAFNRLNDPAALHRVILLVNKGTEGWNCPSLFACALARKLRTSNNFVLQAASRCLRQLPGNAVKARIYLSRENHAVLDRQLRETYGENQRVTSVVRTWQDQGGPIRLERPTGRAGTAAQTTYSLGTDARRVLQQVSATVEIALAPDVFDTYVVARDLTSRYRVDALALRGELSRIYPESEVPAPDLDALAAQVERQTREYEVLEEDVERAVALVKEDAFDRDVAEDGRSIRRRSRIPSIGSATWCAGPTCTDRIARTWAFTSIRSSSTRCPNGRSSSRCCGS
jgi:hypothetical protein